MALLRLSIAFLVSVVSTFCLFGFMRFVTEGAPSSPTDSTVVAVVSPRLVPSKEIEPVRPPKPPHRKVSPGPVVPILHVVDPDEGNGFEMPLDPFPGGVESGNPFARGRGPGGEGSPPIDSGMPDRDALPLVRVDPAYPQAAEQRGLEGWVHLRFTIAADGSVEGAEVVQSSDALFEASALRAVAKWKYRPSMHGGRPIAAPNQQVLLRFRRPT